jgi:pimeloyl-ACP methyl ester carboxylesterase
MSATHELGVTRHFIAAGGRRVHYRAAGAGPPVVMLHGSPGDSEMLEHEIAAAAAHFSVFALDTPGFGFSEALPGETLTVRDLAAATADAMRALGLPPCRVFGTHTGAAIAIELGLGWPERVTGLVMEGLPAFTQDEIDILFRGYFAPMVPDPLGGHLTTTWMRFRDQFTWFPWPSRDVTRLNPHGRPSPAEIHHWVAMFYRGCRSYGPAYRAACFYGPGALRAAEQLRVPAIYTATVEDMLHPHLARLPPLQPHQRIAPLASDAAAKYATLVAYLRELPGGSAGAPAPGAGMVGQAPAMQFFNVPGLQCLVRTYGDSGAPALMIAHDAPGSGVFCDALARDLARRFHVVVPDLPGCGESGAPGEAACILQNAADALRAIADQLNLKRTALLGIGCGAAVAAVLLSRNDTRLSMLLLAAPNDPDDSVAAAIAPDLPLTAEGAHWLRAWLMVRDTEIYQPWCDGSVAAQRRIQGNFDAAFLHERTCALMAARTTYHRLPRAAWRFDTRAAIRHASVPVHILPAGGAAENIIALATPESAHA